jgi:hypothetical protein
MTEDGGPALLHRTDFSRTIIYNTNITPYILTTKTALSRWGTSSYPSGPAEVQHFLMGTLMRPKPSGRNDPRDTLVDSGRSMAATKLSRLLATLRATPKSTMLRMLWRAPTLAVRRNLLVQTI